MNDRIRQLMIESGYAAPEIATRAIRLAELVIAECVNVVQTTPAGVLTVRSRIEEATRDDCALALNHHFGIE